MSKRIKIVFCLACIFFGATGCTSTPTTEFYALGRLGTQTIELENNISSIVGLRRIQLPEYLERANVVSIDNQNSLNVSSYHRWAGDLHQQISRAMESYIQGLTTIDIWRTPWNNSVRPSYQLEVQVNRLDGELGRALVFEAEWRLYDVTTESLMLSKTAQFTVDTSSKSHIAYVFAIDEAISQFSSLLAPELSALK